MKSIGYETRIRIGEQFYNRITADNVKRFIKYKNEKSLKNIRSITNVQLYFDKQKTQVIKATIHYE